MIAQHRRQRLPPRARRGARQASPRRARPSRASASRSPAAAGPGRAGQGAASSRPRRTRRAPTPTSSGRQSRSPSSDFADQGSARAGHRQPRPRRRRRAQRQGGADRRRGQCRRAARAAAGGGAARSRSCRPRVDKAERDLSFTEIRAPVDGVIGNRAAAARRICAARLAARGARAARRASISTPTSRRRSCRPQARPDGRRRGRRDARPRLKGTVASCRRPPARCSSCCRRKTPPATSPRSCSALPVRIERARRRRRRAACCARACRSSSASTPRRPDGPSEPRPSQPQADGRERRASNRGGYRHESSRRQDRAIGPVRSPPDRAGAGRHHRQAQARRLPRHGLRHVHGDPRHPDRLGLADRDPGRPRRLGRRDLLGADRLSDRRGHHDPALGLSVAGASRRAGSSRSPPAASR